MDKTQNLGLTQWGRSDPWKIEDFNTALTQLDTEVTQRGINIRWKGADPAGSANSSTALVAAFSAGSDAIYIPKGVYLITQDLTCPADKRLVFDRNARLKIANGKTLTINGAIEAHSTDWIFDVSLGGSVKGTPKIEMAYPKWFGAKGDGSTIDTVPIQKTFDFFKSVTFTDGTYVVDGSILYSGETIYVISKNAIIKSTGSSEYPVFKNNGAAFITVKETNFLGDNPAIENQLIGVTGSGAKTAIIGCKFQGLTSAQPAIILRQNDFVTIERCIALNHSTALQTNGRWQDNERNITQLTIINYNIMRCKTALELRSIDKATISNVDANRCGSGFHLVRDNKRIEFIACHVEYFGDATYSGGTSFGYAFHMADNQVQTEIAYRTGSMFLPAENALGAIYVGKNEQNRSTASFDDVNLTPLNTVPTGYVALQAYSPIRWNGQWNFDGTQAKLWSSTNRWNDHVIIPNALTPLQSHNLLPFSRVDRVANLPLSQRDGSLAVSAEPNGWLPNGRLLTFTGITNGYYERYVTTFLGIGWHTMVLNGYVVSGNPVVYIQKNVDPFTEALNTRFNVPDSTGQIFRMPFYIGAEGSYRVGFRPVADCSFALSSIEVRRGIHTHLSGSNPSESEGTEKPTEGVGTAGDLVKNRSVIELGTAGSKYVIDGWKCIASGTPGTWVDRRFLTGN